MTFLADRTPRERILVMTALALVILFAGWQFGIKPIFERKAEAEQAVANAQRDMDIVRLGLPKISTAATSNLQAFNRDAAIQTAIRLQLNIARMQPSGNNGLQIWFENTQSLTVYRFMTELTASHNVAIQRVQMTGRENGFVSAQVTLAPIS